jgi:hypothetical protein
MVSKMDVERFYLELIDFKKDLTVAFYHGTIKVRK